MRIILEKYTGTWPRCIGVSLRTLVQGLSWVGFLLDIPWSWGACASYGLQHSILDSMLNESLDIKSLITR